MNILPLSKDPQPDEAEFNAFFPSKGMSCLWVKSRWITITLHGR